MQREESNRIQVRDMIKKRNCVRFASHAIVGANTAAVEKDLSRAEGKVCAVILNNAICATVYKGLYAVW